MFYHTRPAFFASYVTEAIERAAKYALEKDAIVEEERHSSLYKYDKEDKPFHVNPRPVTRKSSSRRHNPVTLPKQSLKRRPLSPLDAKETLELMKKWISLNTIDYACDNNDEIKDVLQHVPQIG